VLGEGPHPRALAGGEDHTHQVQEPLLRTPATERPVSG
jgi:hypothetical protein